LFRFVFPILAIAWMAPPAPAQFGQLDASPTLFTVMAAINAAGFDAGMDSPNNHPLRKAIREELAKREIPVLPALKEFFAKHRKRTDAAELGQYISFALCSSGPPSFKFKLREQDLPPDVTGMRDLPPLLASFYKQAQIENLWAHSQPAIDQYIELYHTPVSDAVLQVNVYLRQQTSGFSGRHFQIFLELLAPPNQVQTRSYSDEYTIVVTPSAELRTFDIRHGYLHYLLDPLALRYKDVLERKKGLGDHAQRALALPDPFKEDFESLATESLIKAVEARLDHKPELVEANLRQGYILTPYFFEALRAFEAQDQAMVLYYRELVGAIDLVKEDARLSQVVFDREATPARPAAPAVASTPPAPTPATEAAKTLEAAEELYKSQAYDKAKAKFLAALEQTDDQSIQAAAYYGLARIAVRENDPDAGERLFHRALDLNPEPFIKGWTLVFLGRLSLAAGNTSEAAEYFQRVLPLAGASDEARRAAQQGLEQTTKK
jgi:tetratricopeptide (TPR) repeat protein